jgi:hypothetical protein
MSIANPRPGTCEEQADEELLERLGELAEILDPVPDRAAEAARTAFMRHRRLDVMPLSYPTPD